MSSHIPSREIPIEYRETVEQLQAEEPQHSLEPLEEYHNNSAGRFTLKQFLRPYKNKLMIAFFIVLVSTFSANIGPLIFAKAIDLGIVGKDFRLLLIMSMVYLGTVLLRIGLRYLSAVYIGLLGQNLLYQLRVKVFTHLQNLSYEYHNTTKAGHTLTRMTSDINALSSLLQDGLINLLVQAMALIIITGVLVYMNALLAVILLLAVVPPMMIATLWFKKVSIPKFRRARSRNADVIADLRQNVYGIKLIHAFNRQDLNAQLHNKVVNEYKTANNDSAHLTSLYPAITGFIEVAAQCIVIYIGYQLVLGNTLTVGELVAFALFLNRFFAPLEQLTLLFREYQAGQAAVEKISGFLSTQPTILEVPDAVDLPAVEGKIVFDDVYFSYKEEEWILKGISLSIAPGETIAVVGATGSGKSTLIKLINRLYDPVKGRVLIDGYDIKQMTLKSLRSQIGVIQQDAFLFHGSIRDNILFARPDATSAEVESACKSACLSDVIARLPDGLDTSCFGKSGVTLSTGERQLIAIARLFLAEPRIVLMDEATSNIDADTEQKIERAVESLLKGRTTITISHRLNSTSRADKVLVVGEQGILESGTHQQLMKKKGLYAQMIDEWHNPSVSD